MIKAIQLMGKDKVLAKMKKRKEVYGRGVERGLKRAGLFIQRKSQEIVPIDTSVLKNSAGTRHTGSGMKTEVRVIYTANYAVYVHEDEDARHAPGKTAKYLERAVKENVEDIRNIVYTDAMKEL